MMAASCSEAILKDYLSLNGEQKYDLLLLLMQNTEVLQLRKVFRGMREFLSFDFISQLPIELAQCVFSFLDASSLCAAAQCCHKWRQMTNSDTLWLRLCKQKGYASLSDLPPPGWSEGRYSRPTSPVNPMTSLLMVPPTSSLGSVCKWKGDYIQAHTLKQNWERGVYGIAPLLRGHRLPVTTIHTEEEILVSGSADNSARVWDLRSLECLHELEGHTDAVNCVVIKNGIIVSGCSDGLVRVFDSRTGQCLKSFHGHTGSIEHVAFNGRLVISGGSDNSLRVWDVHQGKLVHTLTGHAEEIECLWLSEETGVALSGSWDCTLRIWDVVVGICKNVLLGHTEVVYCCGCSRHRVVSGGGDGVLKVWDVESGFLTATLSGHTQEVLCLQCGDDIIVSASADSTIRVWNYSGLCIHVLEGHIGIVRCLVLRGTAIVSGGDRKRIIVWDAMTGKQLHTVHRQKTLLHRMCVTDTQIITASPDSPGTISVISFWP